jgi:hypothetical protein
MLGSASSKFERQTTKDFHLSEYFAPFPIRKTRQDATCVGPFLTEISYEWTSWYPNQPHPRLQGAWLPDVWSIFFMSYDIVAVDAPVPNGVPINLGIVRAFTSHDPAS